MTKMNMTCDGGVVDMKILFNGKKACFANFYNNTESTTPNPNPTEDQKKEWMKKWKENELVKRESKKKHYVVYVLKREFISLQCMAVCHMQEQNVVSITYFE
jgi:hypothetical protein